ncbi:MAG TPA: Pr6Pr family membrane protein [Chitinophagaceae bacterium]|nr:Pr6Pr family membrane protein [Chitinophagaceae bacterium]
MEKKSKAKQFYLSILAILGWFALALQFYLIIQNRVVSIPETIVRYFSFFTLLTNILVALYCSCILLRPYSRMGKFFSRPGVATAITVYIVIVGIVYNTVLRHLWHPAGLQLIADELLHSATPLMFLLYWLFFVDKGKLNLNTFYWLIYPLVYFIWILIFGALSGFYPYPFINVTELGYNKVILHSGILTVGFLLLSLLFVAIDKLMNPKI